MKLLSAALFNPLLWRQRDDIKKLYLPALGGARLYAEDTDVEIGHVGNDAAAAFVELTVVVVVLVEAANQLLVEAVVNVVFVVTHAGAVGGVEAHAAGVSAQVVVNAVVAGVSRDVDWVAEAVDGGTSVQHFVIAGTTSQKSLARHESEQPLTRRKSCTLNCR